MNYKINTRRLLRPFGARNDIVFALLILFFISASFTYAKEDATSPNTVETFINLGVKFYDKMRYDQAKKYFQEANNLRPNRQYKKFLNYALATLERYEPQLNEIASLNNQLQGAQPEDKAALIEKLKAAHLALGKGLLTQDGYVAIIKSHFDYIISQDPLNLEAYLYLGDINYLGMAYSDAIKNYKKALEIYPDNLFFQQRLGDIYVGVGLYDEANKCYAEAIKLLEKSRLEDRKEKIEYLKKLIAKLPTAFDDIKKLMDDQGYGEVVTLCKKRIAMNPSDVTAITYMGIALEELGQWEQAEQLYKTAIKRNPDYPTPYYHLGKIYLLRRKNSEKAIKEIETFRKKSNELLGLDKNAKEALIAASHTLVYIYHEILRDYKTAVREGRHLVELAPDDQGAHYNLGLSYAYLDKKSLAYNEFQKVIDINPASKIAYAAKDAIEGLQKYKSIKALPYRPEE